MRYLLVDGQGNFGSMDGDPPAHQRYTEVRMQQIAADMLADLDKENRRYGSQLRRDAVHARGAAHQSTESAGQRLLRHRRWHGHQHPPHNLAEVVSGCLALLDDPSLSSDDLMGYITGPDFPTGAIINGRAGIVKAYRTGRGRIYVRARAHVEPADGNRETIVVEELPYLVNKARMIEKIAELVKEKRVEASPRFATNRTKTACAWSSSCGAAKTARWFSTTSTPSRSLQTVFGINCVAAGGRSAAHGQSARHGRRLPQAPPRSRRATHRLPAATGAAAWPLAEGQAVALENIDEVVELIRTSQTPAEARTALMAKGWKSESIQALLARAGSDACRPEDLGEEFGLRDSGLYHLSREQAQAILDLTLNRLTALEKDRLLAQYDDVLKEIAELLAILGSEERQKAVMREEMEDIRERYGDERRTEILSSQLDLTDEDLITEEDVVVTVSHRGYAKTQPLAVYHAQRRGGTGRAATGLRDEDFVEHLLIANSHDTLLCFSNAGKVYWLRVFQIPQGSPNAQGRPLANMLPLGDGERITAILPQPKSAGAGLDEAEPMDDADDAEDVDDADDGSGQTDADDEIEAEASTLHGACVFMATANGTVKKTPLERFARRRPSGLIALALEPGNTLVGVDIVEADNDVMLVASSGKAVRFKAAAVRAMGRTARGVRGIRLTAGQQVIALIVPRRNGALLAASERGYGKRTAIDEFPVKGRGGQGVIAMRTGGRNGDLIGAVQVFDGDEIMLISDQGTLVRTHASDVSLVGRNTQGVRLIRLAGGAKLVGVERIVESANGAPDDATSGTETDALDA